MINIPEFAALPDLASRVLAGSVVYANDELFAQRENLIKPEPAVFSPGEFAHKGKVYDGWETRRRRQPGQDHAIVRLGVPGVIKGVVIDTAWFTGNYPPFASVEAASFEGYPDVDALKDSHWQTLVAVSPIAGDTENVFPISDPHRFTHVRLTIYPDGGVARFRVHGQPVPDPRYLAATPDLAAVENGADVIDCSNTFYSPPRNIIQPGRARTMGEGWENARRRDDGNDHVTIRLAASGMVDLVEIDTSYFVGNAAGWAALRGLNTEVTQSSTASDWIELVPKTRLQPDTRHFFRVRNSTPVSQVRLEVYPDGGIARLRVHGHISDSTRTEMVARWLNLLPDAHACEVLVSGGLSEDEARKIVSERPLVGTGQSAATLAARLMTTI